jgi:thymidylate synthase (FAD)
MVEFKIHAKMPIFVARQWVRHRTANINEYSARYSILDKEFYIPEPEVLASQSKTNRQGRGEVIDPAQAAVVRQLLLEDASRNYEHYEFMLNDDGTGKAVDPDRDMVARELARMDLSLNFYTQWYWKIDLHNLFHFLSLRADPHAQYEIRVYADAMSEIIKDAVPLAWEAYVDYQLEAVRLSRLEKEIVVNLIKERGLLEEEKVFDMAKRVGLTGKGEIQEMMDKFKNLGILKGK